MERRDFLRAGFALGAAGLGGTAVLPEIAWADPRHPGGPLRLDSNENALGLAPAARRAVIDGMAEANRYPGARRTELIEALAAKHEVEPANIVLGAGSTEVLQMAVQGFGSPGTTLVIADPTFEDVPSYAEPFEYKLERVPLDIRFAHDIPRMRERAEASGSGALVYICNPNNPTATLTPCREVDAWIESAPEDTYFLLDEAYFEYARDPGYWSSIKWIGEKANVIVARTFSKIYAMAGMRLGYALAHPKAAGQLRRYIAKNNANELALVAGLASLRDEGLVERSLDANDEGRRILYETLEELGLAYLPSYTSFVMHRINGNLESYQKRMREQGILVGRAFPPMLDYNRLSIGRPEEMERFAETLRSFRKRGWV